MNIVIEELMRYEGFDSVGRESYATFRGIGDGQFEYKYGVIGMPANQTKTLTEDEVRVAITNIMDIGYTKADVNDALLPEQQDEDMTDFFSFLRGHDI